jgi:peptidoglycan/xylan/chitin deacetylase (PgdA/CDA1 family)
MGKARKATKRVLRLVVPRRYIVWKHAGGHPLYLTFDDGPHPEFTPRVLDLLGRLGVPATFFLVAERALAHRDLVREIVSRGHGVGSHSFSHRVLPELSRRDFATEIDRSCQELGSLCGREIRMFRPPKGLVTAPALAYLLRARLQVVLWSIDSLDYRRSSERMIVDTVEAAKPRGGDIVLMHDDNPFTVEALSPIVERERARGLRFGGLSV